jgi:hypothetical protein
VLLTTHPSASGMDDKVKRRAQAGAADSFVNAAACKALAESSAKALEERVKQERKQ